MFGNAGLAAFPEAVRSCPPRRQERAGFRHKLAQNLRFTRCESIKKRPGMEESTMNALLTGTSLKDQNRRFAASGGRSEENRQAGFRPAFMDVATRRVYESRFADGRPAPFHLLDGLPEELVVARSASGGIAAVKSSVVAGFIRAARFYSREEAARCLAGLSS